MYEAYYGYSACTYSEMYLFDTYKFVITEFCQLSTKSNITVYIETFTTFLIQIRIRQTCMKIT